VFDFDRNIFPRQAYTIQRNKKITDHMEKLSHIIKKIITYNNNNNNNNNNKPDHMKIKGNWVNLSLDHGMWHQCGSH
jgi:hypothetical protein